MRIEKQMERRTRVRRKSVKQSFTLCGMNFCVIFWPYYKLYSCYTNISIHKFLDIPSEIPYTKQCAAGEIAVPCTRNPLQRG